MAGEPMNGENKDDDRAVSDYPHKNPDTWLIWAVVFAVVLGIAASFAFWFSFEVGFPKTPEKRVESLAPFGVILGALVTFCTIIWRGLITDRQATEQKRQNDANDRAHFALLLEKGSSLIENTEETQGIAGVALLSAVIEDPASRFSVQAMDVLASHLANHPHSTGALFTNLLASLKRAVTEKGIWSTVGLSLDAAEAKTESEKYWPEAYGFNSYRYTGGGFRGCSHLENFLEGLNIPPLAACFVTKAAFCNCEVKKVIRYCSACSFETCDFTGSTFGLVNLIRNSFKNCDLSDATIETHPEEVASVVRLIERGQWTYWQNRPPRLVISPFPGTPTLLADEYQQQLLASATPLDPEDPGAHLRYQLPRLAKES
ncbi:hypothetical protein [Rhizobium halophytocola]|uniref:Uncharacterized protein n=1 Tax=Rhizobium halophytocola TaxID=735519 RepID=A0ABS4DXW0_9HYPH|nr:hypothetical protein [Rhizobium halophytocola]MBP1850531.1 hypothetical protein [Rhizobium halophytocola]